MVVYLKYINRSILAFKYVKEAYKRIKRDFYQGP